MNSKQITGFRKKLLDWYDQQARDLPWRRTKDLYAIWVSEIMLQQTQVDTVKPYYLRFLKAFPTVKALANSSEDKLLKLWEGLGYYRRARNLHKAAKQVVEQFDGCLPQSSEEWIQLAGIGRYSASAIASIALGEAVAVLDGNVKRVLARLNTFDQPINEKSSESVLWNMADQFLDPNRPGDYNQAMMECGALVCRDKLPDCCHCPVQSFCQAYKRKEVEHYPRKIAKSRIPHITVVAALIADKQGQLLIGKRPSEAMLGGLWEFPGGKVEAKESLEAALAREVAEELDITVVVREKFIVIKHAYSHFKITMHVFWCDLKKGTPKPVYHQKLKWLSKKALHTVAFPGANKKIITELV